MGVLDSPPGGGVLAAPPPLPSALPPAPKPAAPKLPAGAAPQDMRDFADVGAMRRAIYDNVLDAARGIEPVANARHTLQLADVDWADPDEPTIKARKKAILRGETLARRLRGTWRLVDNATGAVVDERKSTLASVPVMTNGGTFVLNGTEYTLANQMRLRPGVFTRVKHNGEVESHVNIMPGRGVSHRYTLDPEKSTFKVAFGQSAVPLLPVLRALGASDKQLREAWGDDVFNANAQAADPKAVDKLVKRLVRTPGDGPENRRAALAKVLTDMPLDPEVTKRTLGQSFDRLGVDSILASTRRILQVHRREADPDDRDALAYQNLLGPEDLFAERLRHAARVLRPVLWKASFKGNLSPLGANFLDKHVKAAITASGLGQPLEEVNPADLLSQITRVSRLGEGGIPSIDSVPEEARNVQPSHYGFVDPLLTPECYDADTEVMTYSGWRKWSAIDPEHEVYACLVDGRLEWHAHTAFHVHEYDGPMYGVSSELIEYMVTPEHRVWCRPGDFKCGGSAYRIESAAEVFGKDRKFQCGGHLPYAGDSYNGQFNDWFSVPEPDWKSNNKRVLPAIRAEDWYEFLGWYLAEGNVSIQRDKGRYVTIVSQSREANPDNCARIEALLARMPFAWHYNRHCRGFVVSGRHLAEYLERFGFSQDKHLPDDVWQAPVEPRRRLLEALLLGEGRRNRRGVRSQFCSSSRRLAEDVQRLAFTLGRSSRLVTEPDSRGYDDAHVVHLHERQEGRAYPKAKNGSHHFVRCYSGKVYCASVPGGLLYVRRNGKTGLWSGNSFKVGVDSRLAFATRKGRDGRIYGKFRDPRSGETVWKTPQEIADLTIAFPGELSRGTRHVYAIKGGRLDNVRRRDVDLVVPDAEGVFNPLANMIPLKADTKGQRVMMGARMLTQALPLEKPEAPHVQSGIPDQDDRSFEEEYGKYMGAVRSDHKGQVVSVTPDEIVVKTPTGETRTVELHNNLPFNRKTFLHNTPLVKPGDPVEPGQLLARSNYTDDKGATALGLNLRTAYIPYKGMNFEDAIVISQAAAKRLSSEHMYQHDTEWEEGTKRGKKTFLSLFPTQFDRKTLDTLDDDGVVKPGTRVEDGHPLVLQAKARDRAHNQIVRGKDTGFSDGTLTWEHHDPGVVTDVEKTDKGVVVTVKSLAEMRVGDKLSGRYGDKGVIAHIVPDEEMPRGPDGKAYEVLVNPLGVITRCYDEQTEFLTAGGWKFGREVVRTDWLACYDPAAGSVELLPQTGPMHAADYSGPMVAYRSKVMDFCVTPNHKMWACGDWPGAGWGEYRADQLAGRRYRLPVAAEPVPTTIYGEDKFYLPTIPRNGVKDTSWSDAPVEIDAGDWAEFLGWYVAEGNTTWDERTGEYRVHVSQSDTAKPLHQRRIADLLGRLPFEWNYNPANIQFHVSSKRLAAYLRPLGLSHEKYVPDWVFDQVPGVRARFLEAYWSGDGSVRAGATGTVSQASTTSRRLADDLHRLLVLQGESGAVYPKNEKVGCRPAWYVSRHSARHRTTAVDGWRKTQYAGKIYCPTVPTGYVVTRRNGRLLLAGNTNPGQVVETVLGKIAAATGKRYAVKDFDSMRDMVEFAREELKKHGMTDLEDAEDPSTQRKIPKVLAGSRFFMKLHHTSESKGQGRGLGGYTNEETPAKGGEFGSKRISLMDINALLSHGAHEVLRDAGAVRGQKNQDYWAAFMSGKTPPEPRVPMVYRKFLGQLRAAGINPVQRGDRTQIMALTDRDVDELAAGREITSADTVDWKDGLKPVPGGLFDTTLTGGHNGNRWSYIKLHEPMPNPVMEEPIRRVLGLTEKKFEQVLAGREELNGLRGPLAIASALNRIDLDKGIASAKDEFRSGKRSARDAAARKWTLLEHAKRLGLHPKDWVLSKVPVLPPAFRPVSVMGSTGRPMVSDPNYLYKELFDANQQLKEMSGLVDDVGDERLTTYRAFKGVTGLGDPTNPKNVERKVKGVLKYVFGDNPKFGVVQRKLLGSTVDTVGRAVITPNPDLDMDSVGLPESKAWEIYKPFVVRRLARRGVPPLRAAELVKAQDKLAKAALQEEMDARPVIVTRAPVLHRYGTMAFRPRLVKGETLQVPPLIVKGFAADFDGDAMNYHVPVSDGAVRDALEKMLPSKNLLAVKSFKVHQLPQNEYLGGLYQASSDVDQERDERYFSTRADMVRAYRRGEIGHNTRVVILNE